MGVKSVEKLGKRRSIPTSEKIDLKGVLENPAFRSATDAMVEVSQPSAQRTSEIVNESRGGIRVVVSTKVSQRQHTQLSGGLLYNSLASSWAKHW